MLSSAVDFFVGFQLGRAEKAERRRVFLGISLVVNLGLLGVFKYFDFFVESLTEQLARCGVPLFDLSSLGLILPVGISFYTFQTMSYSIDVYRRRMEPTRNPLAFFAYVSFFPQLVAGPIERAHSFLPQFMQERKWDAATTRDGLRQILWGFFKKIAIADVCAPVVNRAFEAPAAYDAPFLVFALLLFAFQIYADFSGYTDIARGTARMLGFDLVENFRAPFIARTTIEFWQRWHMSLSFWLRDYLLGPLVGDGSKGVSRFRFMWATVLTFILIGFWHGASWTSYCSGCTTVSGWCCTATSCG